MKVASKWAIALTALVLMADKADADDVLEYGEYLAGECSSCHRLDGKDKGIPPIIGWDPDVFYTMMKMFKVGDRQNKAMESVARSLDDEQMKALAAFFQHLGKDDE